MTNQLFLDAEEVASILHVSKPFAYKLVREMNAELRQNGYMIVAGRVSRKFFEEKFIYGEKEVAYGGN